MDFYLGSCTPQSPSLGTIKERLLGTESSKNQSEGEIPEVISNRCRRRKPGEEEEKERGRDKVGGGGYRYEHNSSWNIPHCTIIITQFDCHRIPMLPHLPLSVLLYTSDAADEGLRVDLGGHRTLKKTPANS